MNQENHLMNMISRTSISNIFSKRISTTNSRLVANQGLDMETVDKINKLHIVRNCYLTLMEEVNDKENLRYFSNIVTQIDFQLQRLWKFKEDSTYHRFWELPKCDCPKMDNMDTYGTGHRYINPNCLLHGD